MARHPGYNLGMAQSIYFVGLMAVGKTSIGKHLAASLGREFFDSDQVIEERSGVPIAWMFDVEGESAFRDREQAVIDEFTSMESIVLATGGGAVLRPANRRALRSRGCAVHLYSPIDRLMERAAKDKRRPLLQQGDPRETLERLWQERKPLYNEVADYRFLTTGQGARALAEDVERTLRSEGVIRD